jgi:hypothetical protein
MVAKPKSEQEWVGIVMAELCRQVGFADCKGLAQRDLEFICQRIEEKTGVLISLSTMRRLMNGQFSRQPQSATLNAIAQFLGYQHWQEFKLTKLGQGEPGSSPIMDSPDAASSRSKRPVRGWLAAGALVLIAIALFAFLKIRQAPPGNFDKARFAVNRTTQADLPNTVVFKYDLEGVNADSFFIQQSWDKDRRVRVDKHSHTLTDIYYEPGYHIAKLIANDQVIKTLDVSIPTDGWFFYARERKPGSIARYVHSSGTNNGSLMMSREEVVNSGIDLDKEQLYLQVNFPSRMEFSSENYVLHCRIRINEVKNNSCPFFMCEVFCQRNFMYFKSAPRGCASEMKAQFGETVLDGKNNDLSALGSDPHQWQDVIITVKNKKASVQINNTEVLTTSYQQASGLITGLGFISNGLPEVDLISFKTIDGKEIYSGLLNKK